MICFWCIREIEEGGLAFAGDRGFIEFARDAIATSTRPSDAITIYDNDAVCARHLNIVRGLDPAGGYVAWLAARAAEEQPV